ncbi:14250_t:CDS:2, partial [Racocetra fulgida]
DFNIFQDNLIKHIQERINNNDFNKNNIQVSYKINGRRQAMALNNKDDYNAFISKCQKLENSSKSMKESSSSDEDTPKLKTKKSKSNLVLKESKLTTDEIKLANIITQLDPNINATFTLRLAILKMINILH